MKRINRDNFQFACSERIAYANLGVIGIDPDGNLFGGYDDNFEANQGDEFADDERALTPDERRELAEHMIERWHKFRAGF